MMQFLSFQYLLLLRIVVGELSSKTLPSPDKPVALPDWATGWEPRDPDANTQRLMKIARERDQEATKVLAEARARERRAGLREAEASRELEQIRAQGGSVANDTITRIHGASTAAVKLAEQEAAKAKQQAQDADRAVQAHLARAKQQLAAMKNPADLERASGEVIAALTAQDGAARSSSLDAVSMTALVGPSEAADAYARLLQQLILLAEKAKATGTVPELQAQLASEHANVVKLQSLRGSDIEQMSSEPQSLVYGALGGCVVALFWLVYSLACRRQESETKGALQEPLLVSSPYKEPEWTKAEDTEASVDDWRERALEAQQSLQRAKNALQEAEAMKSSNREQLTITQRRVNELEAREAERERSAQEAEAETQQRQQGEARRQAETQEHMDRLKERLEMAEAAVRRSDQESQSAQAAVQESQTRALEALAKVDLDAEEQKARADDLEAKLQEIQEAEAQLKSAQEAHQAQLRETKKELEEAGTALDKARKEAAEVDAKRASAEEKLEQEMLLSRQKSKEKRTVMENADVKLKTALQDIELQREDSQNQVQQLQGEIEKLTAEKTQSQESESQRKQLQEEVQGLSEQIKKSAEELEKSEGLVAQQREQLETAKAAAKDAAQALEAVRQHASAEITTGKKAAADLQAEKEQLQEALDQVQADAELEKARANHSEQLAKSRHIDLEHAQQLTSKAKAELQIVRQELSAECAAAKAQVDVERKLACEAEELAEKSRLDAQTARNAEQEARLAEQEAKAALIKMQKGSTSPRGERELQAAASAAADRCRKEIAAAQAETQEARAAERRLKDELEAASARDAQTQEALAQAKGELGNIRALYAEATAAKALAEQDLVQANGQATAAKEALKSMQDPQETGDLSKAVGS